MVYCNPSWHRQCLPPRPHAHAPTSTGRSVVGDEVLDTIPGHFSSFQHVENLTIAWLDLSDFSARVVHSSLRSLWSSLRSLHFVLPLRRLFGIDDLPPTVPTSRRPSHPHPRLVRRQASFADIKNSPSYSWIPESPLFRLSFLPVRLASGGLDLWFSPISISTAISSSSLPLNNLLEASSSTLLSLELEYITFCGNLFFPFLASRSLIHFPAGPANVSLIRCENLQDVTVGAFEEGGSPLLLLSLLSALSSYHLTHFTIDFVAIPSPHWPEWKTVDAHLLQMTERCGLRERPQVVLRTRLGMPGESPLTLYSSVN
jgi:hypothetical protein